MPKWSLSFVVFSLLVLLSSSSNAQGNPQQIFEECKEKIRVIQVRSIERMEAITAECIRRIEELQAAGQHERARAVAGECIDLIRMTARRAMGNITEVCHRCVNALRELGANELADRLEAICIEARRNIATKANALIARIRSKF
ncbi:MAG: hypothetical protein ABL888_21225 [Pirellulaceae bacterium]